MDSNQELQHLVVLLLLTQAGRPTDVSNTVIFGCPSDWAVGLEAVQTEIEDKSPKQDVCKRARRCIALETACSSVDAILMDVETSKDLDHPWMLEYVWFSNGRKVLAAADACSMIYETFFAADSVLQQLESWVRSVFCKPQILNDGLPLLCQRFRSICSVVDVL